MTLKAIRKKRKLFGSIVTYSFVATFMLTLVMNVYKVDFKENIFTHILAGVIMGICLLTSFYLIFVRWFPEPKGHKLIGEVTFEHDAIRRTHFGKKLTYQIDQLFELKFLITGYLGQNISLTDKTKIVDGTGNVVILVNKDRTTKKIEFLLENEKNLNTLITYAEGYKRLTKVVMN